MPNYAIKPSADQALRRNKIIVPRRLIAALDLARRQWSRTTLAVNRAKYVVRTQGHHPGYTDYLVISTEGGLIELSQAIERLSKFPNGARIDFRVGDRSKFGTDGHIAFAVCSDENLQQQANKSFKSRGLSLLASTAMFALLLIGAVHSFNYVLMATLWVASKV